MGNDQLLQELSLPQGTVSRLDTYHRASGGRVPLQLPLRWPASGITGRASSVVRTASQELLSVAAKASRQNLRVDREELACSLPTALLPVNSLPCRYSYHEKKIISLAGVGTSMSYEFEPCCGPRRCCPR